MTMKKMTALGLLLALLLCLVSGAGAEGLVLLDLDAGLSDAPSDGVTFAGGVLTIKKAGEYLLSGTLDNGQIYVNCDEDGKVILHLNGLKVHCENGPALLVGYVSSRIEIDLADGSENTLSNGQGASSAPDEQDGVIFSRSDLTIRGSGALSVDAEVLNGIVSRDDIRIEGGKLDIQAAQHGIKGKDAVEISGGDIVIRAGRDGIKATNKTDPDRGYLDISGGKISLTFGDEAISFMTSCRITGGELYFNLDQQ